MWCLSKAGNSRCRTSRAGRLKDSLVVFCRHVQQMRNASSAANRPFVRASGAGGSPHLIAPASPVLALLATKALLATTAEWMRRVATAPALPATLPCIVELTSARVRSCSAKMAPPAPCLALFSLNVQVSRLSWKVS